MTGRRFSTAAATAVLVAFVVLVAATVAIRIRYGPIENFSFVGGAGFLAYPIVGYLVATRRPANPLGWIFLGVGLLTAVGGASAAVLSLAVHWSWPLSGPVVLAAWVQVWFWYPLFALGTLFSLLLYPSGLPSRRWRPVLWLGVGVTVVMAGAAALRPELPVSAHRRIANPVAVPDLSVADLDHSMLSDVTGYLLVALVLAAAISLVIRYRRSHGIERQQLKWFAAAAALLGLSVAAAILVQTARQNLLSDMLLNVGLSGVPVACGLGILRYRLYDIDRIISRALAYLLLTGLVVAVYAGTVTLATQILPLHSTYAVAAATLAAVAAANPLRRRLQSTVDRRFNRARYDATRTVEAFADRLRTQVDLDDVRTDLLTAVHHTVQPTHAALWLAEAAK